MTNESLSMLVNVPALTAAAQVSFGIDPREFGLIDTALLRPAQSAPRKAPPVTFTLLSHLELNFPPEWAVYTLQKP